MYIVIVIKSFSFTHVQYIVPLSPNNNYLPIIIISPMNVICSDFGEGSRGEKLSVKTQMNVSASELIQEISRHVRQRHRHDRPRSLKTSNRATSRTWATGELSLLSGGVRWDRSEWGNSKGHKWFGTRTRCARRQTCAENTTATGADVRQ